MTPIVRDPKATESEHYDIVIVGGGIYGAMLLLEAARREKRALLLESQDFGSGTSYNSLRIIHGGLRYLQSLDLPRFRESVAERRWFLQTFPDLVRPLPCLMPLYDRGVKRPSVLRAALRANDFLSARRNDGLDGALHIRNGQILSPDEVTQVFPGAIRSGLSGAALWYDAHVPDSQRIIIETLRWACSLGARALNYVNVGKLLTSDGSVIGVQATDQETGKNLEIRCTHVINATGPASRQFAAAADRDLPSLFRPSIAWNVLFDCPAPSSYALALTPDIRGAQTYFIHPWKGRLLAGTGHFRYHGSLDQVAPNRDALQRFVDDLNCVLPDANLTMDGILRVYSGLLPVTHEGGTKLTRRAIIHDHGRNGGPKGFFSVSGIKFTTARREAEKALRLLTNDGKHRFVQRPVHESSLSVTSLDYDWMPDMTDDSWKRELETLIKRESVLHLDDLAFRRTSIANNPQRGRKLATEIASIFDWDDSRRKREVNRLLTMLRPG